MKKSLILSISLLLMNVSSSETTRKTYSNELMELIGCNNSMEEYKIITEKERTEICHCNLEKLAINDWSTEEACLLANLSEDKKLLEKCKINHKAGENETFRPLIEQLMEIGDTCYEKTTGKSLYLQSESKLHE